MNENNNIVFSFTLDPELYARLEKFAESHNMSVENANIFLLKHIFNPTDETEQILKSLKRTE